MKKVCCVTGHRPEKFKCGNNENHKDFLLLKKIITKQLVFLIENYNVKIFLSGLARGADMWFVECVVDLKKKHKDITIVGIIPCAIQMAKWKCNDKVRYLLLVNKCDEIIILSEKYTSDCMHTRNKYMVDNSDFVLGIMNKGNSRSGTRNTLIYAYKKIKKIIIIHPNYSCEVETFNIRKKMN